MIIDPVDSAQLKVHVLDAKGKPVVGAQATAAGHHAKSGKDGVATFASVPRTTVQVSVRASGHGPGAAAVKIGKSQASAEATVRLPWGATWWSGSGASPGPAGRWAPAPPRCSWATALA